MDIPTLAEELNRRASGYRIGRLQEIRAARLHSKRRAGSKLFTEKTIHPEWAFHHGGRSELQFNIGLEEGKTRHGVAFSFEPSQTLPNPEETLGPKVRRFNEVLSTRPTDYADFTMWYWHEEGRSHEYEPMPIQPEIARLGYFIFLGSSQPSDQIDFDLDSAVASILTDFDRLLPLYEFVEDAGLDSPKINPGQTGLGFAPGDSTEKRSTASASRVGGSFEIALRHNTLQGALIRALSRQFGKDAVDDEVGNGEKCRVDVVVRRPNGWWFYEIKTASSARLCIREGLAQLVEYSFWPGNDCASRLIVVGEPPLHNDAESFLRILRERFALPVFYQQLDVGSAKLTPMLEESQD